MDEDYLTIREAAQLLRLKERRLYDLVRQGSLPSVRVSGRWLFPRAALERFLAGHTQSAGTVLTPQAPRPPVIGGSNDPLLDWTLRECGADLALMALAVPAGEHVVEIRFTAPRVWQGLAASLLSALLLATLLARRPKSGTSNEAGASDPA